MRSPKRISVLTTALLLLVFTVFFTPSYPQLPQTVVAPHRFLLLSGLLDVNANLLRSVLCAPYSRFFLAILFYPPSVCLPKCWFMQEEGKSPLLRLIFLPVFPGACVPRDSLHFLHRYRPWPRNTQVRSHKTEEWVGVLISRHSAGGSAKKSTKAHSEYGRKPSLFVFKSRHSLLGLLLLCHLGYFQRHCRRIMGKVFVVTLQYCLCCRGNCNCKKTTIGW